MKNFSTKLLLLLLLLGADSCKKDDFIPVMTRCTLEGTDIRNLRGKAGVLVYYDAAHFRGYFIQNHNVAEVSNLMIKICNFPESEFPDLKPGDSLKVNFEGRVVVLPTTVDAMNTDIELSAIRVVK